MLLIRSSSTPILGSLLSSSSPHHFNGSPSSNRHILDKATSLLPSSFPHPPRPSSISCHHLSPLSDSSSGDPSAALGFRRARSDGNLHSMLSTDHKANPALDTIPSFSLYSGRREEEYGENEEEDDGDQFDEGLIGGEVSGGYSFMGRNQNLNLLEGERDGGSLGLPLFLARGLGIDRLGSGLLNAGGGGGGGGDTRNGNGGEKSDIEMYYRRMVDENPSNALFLSNFAQFLYQTKGDAKRAEEYYSRAILAEPEDGEILSQYAKLVWELHRDQERASSYFEQAVQATPNDSNVLGAYASFLWETEEDDGEGGGEDGQSQDYFGAPKRHEIFA